MFLLPKRPRDSHKGDFGHVLVIGGDYGMAGAVRLAAEAALRIGAGLVSVATRPEHLAVVGGSRPEILCYGIQQPQELESLLTRSTVIVIGPGLGQSAWSKSLLTLSLQSHLPKIIDADALNLLSEKPEHRSDWILTPHPGEAARLLNINSVSVQRDRLKTVTELQKHYGGVVVLKGANTVVQGEGKAFYQCEVGNPGMSTAGMGDVLSGVIAGLVAQQVPLFDAAELGVFLHATAGDLAAKEGGERGLIASDLFPYLRVLVNHS